MRRNCLGNPAALLLLAATIALSTPVLSQPSPNITDAAAQADEHFRKGKELLKDGKKLEAREEYLAALKLKKSYDVAGNLGSLELLLKMPRDAAEHLAFAVRNYASSGTTPEQLEKAKQKLAEAKKQVGTVRVAVSVDGAEVLVDGVSVGRAPLDGEVFVEPGARVLEARLAGYEPARQSVQAEKGAEQAMTLTLAQSAPKVATTATSSASVPPTASGVPSAPPIKEEPRGGPNKTIVIAGGATAGAALIAGVVFTVVANGKASDAAQQRMKVFHTYGSEACGPHPNTDCQMLHGFMSDQATYSNVALSSFIGAGAVGVATAIYVLATRRSTTKTGVRTAPVLTGSGAGVIVGGTW